MKMKKKNNKLILIIIGVIAVFAFYNYFGNAGRKAGELADIEVVPGYENIPLSDNMVFRIQVVSGPSNPSFTAKLDGTTATIQYSLVSGTTNVYEFTLLEERVGTLVITLLDDTASIEVSRPLINTVEFFPKQTDQGTTVELKAEFYNQGNELLDVDAANLEITKPSGNIETVLMNRESPGKYSYSIKVEENGFYYFTITPEKEFYTTIPEHTSLTVYKRGAISYFPYVVLGALAIFVLLVLKKRFTS
jgi:hypothetical protein